MKEKLALAKKNKKDEFYTQLTDIEKELNHYKEHFKNKVVFCNCDDPKESNFFKYFALNFKYLQLKRLVATHYNEGEKSYKLEIVEDINKDGKINLDDAITTPLKGNGDFRSEECIKILEESDIVVTNPPFSLFREYIAQLIEYNKKFVIVGHQNAISYKEIFQLIKENKIWLGYGFKGGAGHFINKFYEDYASASDRKEGMIRVSGVHWFTNLEIKKRYEDLILYKKYNQENYPKYDNFDAIHVARVSEIPFDYYGIMGVPLTYLKYHNDDDFEIVGEANHGSDNEYDLFKPQINGKETFKRILIKRRERQR